MTELDRPSKSNADPTASQIEGWLVGRLHDASKAICPRYHRVQWFECDVARITKADYFIEYEVKVSASDLKADFKKSNHRGNKHELLAAGDFKGPNQFWFVIPDRLWGKVADHIPDHAGVMLCTSRWNFKRVKEAPRLHHEKVPQFAVSRIVTCMAKRYMWHIINQATKPLP